jgi:hypothetical protein
MTGFLDLATDLILERTGPGTNGFHLIARGTPIADLTESFVSASPVRVS